MTRRVITCDDCNAQVKQTSLCICGMWTCARCTLSERHDTGRGEHWNMLVARMSPEEQADIKRFDEISRSLEK
jgi:hypothetical protein